MDELIKQANDETDEEDEMATEDPVIIDADEPDDSLDVSEEKHEAEKEKIKEEISSRSSVPTDDGTNDESMSRKRFKELKRKEKEQFLTEQEQDNDEDEKDNELKEKYDQLKDGAILH
ncbi:MAG: hypothetical protein MUP66_01185 [Candidatus Nanohaloarchaeota archaeon QJJ-5]|nr:hypothetical protein [Candidatus Nanohaloarchaeota archaeon QJJ-5]